MRQLKEPDFFIPAKDRMHQPEKLPKIQVLRKNSEVVKKEKKKEHFVSVPEYKNKYDKYMANLTVFAKTKTMPEDKELEADLAAFAEGEIFEVTQEAPQKIISAEQKAFYDLVNQIIKN